VGDLSPEYTLNYPLLQEVRELKFIKHLLEHDHMTVRHGSYKKVT